RRPWPDTARRTETAHHSVGLGRTAASGCGDRRTGPSGGGAGRRSGRPAGRTDHCRRDHRADRPGRCVDRRSAISAAAPRPTAHSLAAAMRGEMTHGGDDPAGPPAVRALAAPAVLAAGAVRSVGATTRGMVLDAAAGLA